MVPSTSGMTIRSERSRYLVIYLCLALITVVVYWPVRHFDFVYYDDPQYITENPDVQHGTTLRTLAWAFTTPLDLWMPVTWLARIVVCQAFGLNAGAHHSVNVLFHVVNALLLFHVLNRMTRAPWRSAFVAALFAVHPLHAESVAWVTCLKDVLSTCFWLLTLGAYGRYVERLNVEPPTSNFKLRTNSADHGANPRTQCSTPKAQISAFRLSPFPFYTVTLFLFTLALMSKPMVVTLPFVLLLLDYWPLGRTRWTSSPTGANVIKVSPGDLLKEKLPFFGLAAVVCVVTYYAQRVQGAVISLENAPARVRIANALLAYIGYLGKTLWPTKLAFLYPLDTNLSLAPAVGAGAALIGITTLVIWRARSEPWLVTGWFWYLGTLVPVIGMVEVGIALAMADRYTYIPLVGPFIMMCWSVPRALVERRSRKMAVSGIAVVLLGFYAFLSRSQVNSWRNSETLLRHALQVTADNWVAQNNLGLFLWRTGKTDEAIEHYQEALRLKPDYGEAHHNLGLALSHKGDLTGAIQHFEEVVRIKPGLAEARRRLGLALQQAGRLQAAIAQFEFALQMKPDSAGTHNDLGNAFLQAGRPRDAIEQYDLALNIHPDLVEAQNNLAWLLATLPPTDGGDPLRAVTLAQRACELTDRQMAEYLDTLAVANAAAGRFTNAITTADEAITVARRAGRSDLAEEIAARLELYRAGHVYRPRLEAAPSH